MKQTANKIEHSKLQGFDVLDKLPEEQMLKSYNEEFYNSLTNNYKKLISLSIPQENKLFYHFEQNENASVSTTTGQLLSTYEELFNTNERIKKNVKELEKELGRLREELQIVDKNIIREYRPEIIEMQNRLKNYLVEQKTENFKLIKEIAILEKEKADLQQEIYNALGKLHKLEKEVGVKAKAYTYIYDQTITENEISNKFIIEKEDI